MQICSPMIQSEACKQANKPEVMIAMQVRNEYMIDFAAPDFIGVHLHLSSFATVN